MKYELSDLKAAAHGRWPEIHAALGVPSEYLNTRKHCPCPHCGGRDRYRYTDHQGTGGFICNQCRPQGGGGFDLLMLVFGYDFKEAAHQVAALLGFSDGHSEPHQPPKLAPKSTPQASPQDKQARLLEVWNAAAPLTATDPVISYLTGRGLEMADYPPSIRYHAALTYWTECTDGMKSLGSYPAMIAAITERDGTLAGLHITYLQARDGKPYGKLNIYHPDTSEALPAKKMQTRFAGMGWLSGKAVCIDPPQDNAMMVCEGIETALAAKEMTGWPTWAALSANSMAALQWPESLEMMGIYADHDTAGLAAAEKLARRATLAGVKVIMYRPDTPDTDALDELNAIRAAAGSDSMDD